MTSERSTPRLLGAAFLIQAVGSAVSGFFLLDPLIVPGNIVGTMDNISSNILQMRASIVVQMITAIGIVMLGVLLYRTLKEQNANVAFVAMGLYIMEAAILAASRIPAFALMGVSQESVAAGHPAYLQSLANMLNQAQDFGFGLHMLPFAVGATLFYVLFYRSGFLPRALALLGLIAAPLALVGILFYLLGYDIAAIVFMPNLPFELGAGLWLVIKGIPGATQRTRRLVPATSKDA